MPEPISMLALGVGFVAAGKAVDDIDKGVGVIAKLVGKLKAKPDLAALKLAQALGEVAKTLQVVDNAAALYLSLGIDQNALEANSLLLLNIDGGSLSTEVMRGRGHCHLIESIYHDCLDKWFHEVFQPNDYASAKTVFQDLSSADGELFRDLEQVAVSLEAEANVVLDLVLKGEKETARKRVLSAMTALRPLRKTISKTMQTLYAMQSEFVDIAGAV